MSFLKGFSLVEIMISLLLSCLLFHILLELYLNSKKHYAFTQVKVEKQIEEQLVAGFISDSVRRAGFTPCLSLRHLNVYDSRTSSRSIKPFAISGDQQQTLQIFRMSEIFFRVVRHDRRHLLVKQSKIFKHGTVLMIADCSHGETATVEASRQTAEGIEVSLTSPLIFDYQYPYYAGEWLEENFFTDRGILYYQNHARKERLGNQIKDVFFSYDPGLSAIQFRYQMDDEKPAEWVVRIRA